MQADLIGTRRHPLAHFPDVCVLKRKRTYTDQAEWRGLGLVLSGAISALAAGDPLARRVIRPYPRFRCRHSGAIALHHLQAHLVGLGDPFGDFEEITLFKMMANPTGPGPRAQEISGCIVFMVMDE